MKGRLQCSYCLSALSQQSVTLGKALDLTFIITKRMKQQPPFQGAFGLMRTPVAFSPNLGLDAVTGVMTSKVTLRDLSITINKILHQHCIFKQWIEVVEDSSEPSISEICF